MNRKILITLVLALLAVSVISQVFAAVQTEDNTSAWSVTTGTNMKAVHPSVTQISADTFTFNASKGGYLYNLTVQMKIVGSPVAILKAYLGGCENAWNHAPNSTTYITSSNEISTSDLTTSYANVTFQFDKTYQLLTGEKYAMIIYVESATTIGGANYVALKMSTLGGHNTYFWYYLNGWTGGSAANDVQFEILSDTESGGSAPVDTGGMWTGDYDELIASFMSFVIPLLIILLPVLLLIVITKSTDKWIILIGLTIGVGLGFYFGLVPLWLVFLVVIGLIGMAYQSVRGGG